MQGLPDKDIRSFYESIMVANNAVLAIFGDIDPGPVALKVQKAFRDFKLRTLQEPVIEVETRNISRDERFETFNEKTSAAILVGYNG